MFEHPEFLTLLIFLPIFWALKGRYFLKHPYLAQVKVAKQKTKGKEIWKSFPYFFQWIGWILLILAAADLGWERQKVYEKSLIHNYVLINDGSGSMVEGFRDKGIGVRLKALRAGNKKFLNLIDQLKRPDGARDFVGMVAFASEPFVVSYLIDDPKFVEMKFDQIDWRVYPMAQGTEINRAIWSGVLMFLKHNSDYNGTTLTDLEFSQLATKLLGSGEIVEWQRGGDLENKLLAIKEEIIGSSFILFTDGEVDLRGTNKTMAVAKLLKLCEYIGIRGYLISVEQIPPDLSRFLKATGGEAMLLNEFNEKELEAIYQGIVSKGAGEKMIATGWERKTYAFYLAIAALALLVISSVLRNSISRSLTTL